MTFFVLVPEHLHSRLDQGSPVIFRVNSVRPSHLSDRSSDHDYLFELPFNKGTGYPIHVSSNLVLVPVIALNAKNGLPDKTLKQSDFQVFDDGHPVAIKTFDSGAQSATRPLALWFVVQCNMQGYEAKGSGLFTGKVSLLQPALQYIARQDTVAVAHWCDDGQSYIDLLPTGRIGDVPKALEQALAIRPDTKSHGRAGELALQNTLQHIVDTSRSSKSDPLPVLIFLYGDYSSMDKSEANHFIDELLETSAIAFGVGITVPRIYYLRLGSSEQSRTISPHRLAGNTLMLRPIPIQTPWQKFCSSCIFVMSWDSNQKCWTASAISFGCSSSILRRISARIFACDTASPTCQPSQESGSG